ncbi:amino acid permease [Aciditerrimonas ferrireducens]|uniref:Amino acid permease n=1 Tax=Aciditerrimonas ferrireducens TaxID=667306 RepID=A0ABV6C0B3_9ACTN
MPSPADPAPADRPAAAGAALAAPAPRNGAAAGEDRPAFATPPPVIPTPESFDLPEPLSYRIKNKLLGPPLTTDKLASERLGKIAALGVLSPDCISSSAYGTEEMLTQLVPFFGAAAFMLVVPVTLAILAVLFFVTLSYREVIAAYTKAGGSYVVARDNFGLRVAQIAAVALLIDYTVTVAVQCTAGTEALTSIVPSLTPYTLPITVGVILFMCYGNLRGIREGAKIFALPTYLFVVSLGITVVVGYARVATGTAAAPLHFHHGMVAFGHHSGLIEFAAILTLLKAFANGGSSLTGLEAISNGVASFRQPQARNARRTLVVMSCVLGFLVLGVTVLAHFSHATPYVDETPTVVAQIAGWVWGSSTVGKVVADLVVVFTMLILFTGGNTSFNGFPYLTSFVAQDSFLPRQLTRRGHRLAFSNGIIVLTIVALALVVGTDANLNSLVALYAIGVFTGFTMAGFGMVKHHRTLREPGWQWRQVINGFAGALSLAVVLIFLTVKFTQGAWLVAVAGPLLYLLLIRLNRQYRYEAALLEAGAAQACEAPILRRHAVIVMVERLDLATARAMQYARTLMPDELRAVHLVVDSRRAAYLEDRWTQLGLSRFPLDLVECPDRRLGRAALELAAQAVADGDTELTVLLPRRAYTSRWARILHDRTADRIVSALGRLAHVNATLVPFHVPKPPKARAQAAEARRRAEQEALEGRVAAEEAAGRKVSEKDQDKAAQGRPDRSVAGSPLAVGTVPIGSVTWRRRAKVAGRVSSVRVQPRAGVASVECVLTDDTGGILLVFQGRRRVPGIRPGTRLVAEGMVGQRDRRLAIVNPVYELVAEPEGEDDGGD